MKKIIYLVFVALLLLFVSILPASAAAPGGGGGGWSGHGGGWSGHGGSMEVVEPRLQRRLRRRLGSWTWRMGSRLPLLRRRLARAGWGWGWDPWWWGGLRTIHTIRTRTILHLFTSNSLRLISNRPHSRKNSRIIGTSAGNRRVTILT